MRSRVRNKRVATRKVVSWRVQFVGEAGNWVSSNLASTLCSSISQLCDNIILIDKLG